MVSFGAQRKPKNTSIRLQSRAAKAVAAQFPSPTGFGDTVQNLFEAGITFPAPNKKIDSVYVRGWSLKDFWEYTTWPRDAATDVRFGLPVVDDLPSLTADGDDDEDEGRMISAPPFRGSVAQPQPEVTEEVPADDDNPYVLGVTGVKGLQEKIVENKTTCLLFVSAPFCRTCRYLKPKYQRMARNYIDNAADQEQTMNFVFAKAEAVGHPGKELGKALGVDSVPSFVMFKKGRRFGKPLSVSRIPSEKLERAVELLQNDEPWNEAAFLGETTWGLPRWIWPGETSTKKALLDESGPSFWIEKEPVNWWICRRR